MLENDLQQMIGLAGAYGFIQILPQKNPHMISFRKEEEPDARINWYFTTGTVQVQYKNDRKPQTITRGVTLYSFEDILQNI